MTSLQQLGQTLRKRREHLGLGLEEVRTRTKIRARYLEALEAGEWDVLPGEVYARGFVRSYAECVDLDGLALLKTFVDDPRERTVAESDTISSRESTPTSKEDTQSKPTDSETTRREADQSSEPFVAPYHTGYQPGGAPENEGKQVRKESTRPAEESRMSMAKSQRSSLSSTRSTVPKRRRPKGQFGGVGGQAAVVVAVLIVLGGGWWLIHRSAGPSAGSYSGNQLTPAGSIGNASGNQALGTSNNATQNSTGLGSGGQNGTSPSTGNGTSNATSATQVTTQPFQSQSHPPTQTYLVQTTGTITVTLTIGSSPCWISVSSDGNVVDGSETLQSGQSKNWTGTQTIDITLGNPPAATLTINGQAVVLPQSNSPYHVVVQKTKG